MCSPLTFTDTKKIYSSLFILTEKQNKKLMISVTKFLKDDIFLSIRVLKKRNDASLLKVHSCFCCLLSEFSWDQKRISFILERENKAATREKLDDKTPKEKED